MSAAQHLKRYYDPEDLCGGGWELNDEEIAALDLQGAASPMEVEGELPDMNAGEMAKEGFYLVKSVLRHRYRQGWCFRYCCVVGGLYVGPANALAACGRLQVNLSIRLGICSSEDESDGYRRTKKTRVLSGVGHISPTLFRSSSVGWLESSMTIDVVVVPSGVLLLCRSFLSSSCTLGAAGAKNCLCYQLLPLDSFFVREG